MVDGELLSHLRFADDIVLFAYDVQSATEMLKELNEASTQVGLRINRAKTQAMKNGHCAMGTITLDDDTILFVDKYTYPGQIITQNHEIDDEIRRRRSAAWLSFKKCRRCVEEDERCQITSSYSQFHDSSSNSIMAAKCGLCEKTENKSSKRPSEQWNDGHWTSN